MPRPSAAHAHRCPLLPLPACSLVGAGIICLSSFFVAFSQKRQAAAKSAGARWQRSVARLSQEGGAEADAPLLGRQRSLGGGGSPAAGASGSLDEGTEDWASAREGSTASLAFGGSEWGDGASGGGLKAEVKEAAAAVAAAAAAEVQQPDTPAAPPSLPMAALTGEHGSSPSLLGTSPDASVASEQLLGSSPPGGPATDAREP